MIRKHVYSYYYIPAVKGDISRCAAQALTGMIPTEENAQVESEFSAKGGEQKLIEIILIQNTCKTKISNNNYYYYLEISRKYLNVVCCLFMLRGLC